MTFDLKSALLFTIWQPFLGRLSKPLKAAKTWHELLVARHVVGACCRLFQRRWPEFSFPPAPALPVRENFVVERAEPYFYTSVSRCLSSPADPRRLLVLNPAVYCECPSKTAYTILTLCLLIATQVEPLKALWKGGDLPLSWNPSVTWTFIPRWESLLY